MTALITGIAGERLTAEDRRLLQHPLVQGVILFKRNYRDYTQLQALVRHIRALKGRDFLISVDQEGGRVARFDLPFTRLPALGEIGAVYARDPDLARALAHAHGWLMATELLSVGVDLSFAPVLDIDNGSEVIGDRAFSADPDVVTELGDIYCGAMHTAGMKTTGKHFPGHGTVRADSHHELPVDRRPMATIFHQDMRPFARLIKHGKLDAVMMSHVIYASGCDAPAGFSSHWTQRVLREELGFTGAIISDDLGMEAAFCAGDVAGRYRACVEAGADIALTCTPELTAELLPSLPVKAPSRKARQACLSLRGEPVRTDSRPFWQQQPWVAMRRTLVELESMAKNLLSQ